MGASPPPWFLISMVFSLPLSHKFCRNFSYPLNGIFGTLLQFGKLSRLNMDKRSLLFLFCISIAFFGIQTWFGSQRATEMQEQKVHKEAPNSEAVSRIAKLDQLPIIPLFADPEGHQKIATGIAIGDSFLTLAWTKDLPSTLYIQKEGRFESIALATRAENVNEPVLYSMQGAEKTEIPALPENHFTDVQLLTVNAELRVVLGEQKGKEFTLPFHFLDEPAIALIKERGDFLPVGIYDPKEKRVKALSDFKKLSALVQQAQTAPLSSPPTDETFYVLENEYQQLVFSTRGGALAEINLPLKSSKDSKSLVKEIDIDRQILANSPQNARFPLFSHYSASEKGKTLNQEGALGGYYPLLRRAILNPDGREKSSVSPEYYALNIVGEDPDIGALNYRVTRFEPNLIQFEASTSQRRIVKTFSIPQERNGPYCLLLDVQIDGDSRGLWISSGVPDVELVGGSYAPLLRYQITRNNASDVETIDLPKKGPTLVTTVQTNWISNSNGFLGLIVDPLSDHPQGYKAAAIEGTVLPTRLSLIDSSHNLYPAANYPGYATYLPLKSGPNLPFRIFAGPFDDSLLKELDALYDDPLQNYNPEYTSAQSIQGWFSFISEPFAKFLFLLMQLFYAITRSWAVAIILLTISLRAMMYPLNAWSIRSSIKMQEIAPKVKIVQDRYKKDPRKAQMEVMNLYKESGVNPFTGCLPMLLQMPFLIGMFYLLKSSFPLRGAPFIPGWIDDLAAPDILFTWGQPLWFIGNELHLLPILMGVSMYLQQRLTSKLPKDPKQISDTQKQQKMMGNMMSILFTVMFYSFPSGLNIYFMFSTLLGVLQQWWMMKKSKTVVIVKS